MINDAKWGFACGQKEKRDIESFICPKMKEKKDIEGGGEGRNQGSGKLGHKLSLECRFRDFLFRPCRFIMKLTSHGF